MKRKSIKLMATTLLLSTMLSFTSLAGWEQSEQGWKYKDDTTNVYVTAKWIESNSEQGLWYYLNEQGIMAVNTVIDNQYYVNDKGEWRESTGGNISNNGVSQPSTNESSGGVSWVPDDAEVGTSGGWGIDGVIVG